jgi:toluene monooxygenase system ferredoxin subunit
MFQRVMARDELWTGEMIGVLVGGRKVLLLDVGGEVVAFPDRCRHQGVPLSQGKLQAGIITCSAHGWEYDARTGRGRNPSDVALPRLAVEIRDGEIWVDVQPPG